MVLLQRSSKMWKKFAKFIDAAMWVVLPLNALSALLHSQYAESFAWAFSFVIFAELWALKKTLPKSGDE
jgi:hypothetical protein